MDGFQELLKAGGGKVRTAKADDETVTRLLDTVQNSLRTQESGGAKNPLRSRNSRTSALGAFQVLPSNIPAWTSKYLGKSMSEEEFASNEDAQIKVFRGQFGSYLRETLNESDDEDTAIRKASAMWYGGPRGKKQYDNPVRFRPDEPSYREYTTSILNRIKKGQVSKPDQTGDDEFQKLLKAGEGPDEFEQLLEYGANLQTKSEIPTTGKVESEIPNKPVESKTAQRTETTSEPKIYDDLESFSTKINLQIKRPLKFTEEALESRRSGVPLATNVPETREQTNREIVIDAISSEISSRLSNEYRKVDPEDVVFVLNKYGMKGDDPNDASTFYNFKVDMNDPSDRDFIETVLQVNEQKTQAAQQLLASGMPISSNLMKQYEEAIGLSYEFIEKAKTDPKFKQAVTQGAAVKKIYDGYVKELLKGLKPGESPELAFNGAAAYVGWINDEQLVQANNKAREGFEALKNEVSSSVFDAERIFLEYVQKPLAVTSPLYMGNTSEDVTQWTSSQIDEMTKSLIKRYGSAENYYRVQEELRNKYKAGSGNAYAGPFEFVKRFGVGALKVLPQAVKVGAIIGDASKGGIVLSTEANPVWKLGDKIEKYLDDLKNNDFDDVEAISLVADTTGQLFAQIVAGIVSGGATLPTLIGAVSGFSGASDEAIKAGADPATTAAAGIVGALAAAPDGLILGKWFKGLKGPAQLSFLEKLSASLLRRFGIEYGPEAAQAMTKKTMGDMLKLGGKNLLFGTTTEGPQEVLENKTNDLAAFILYDRTPERWDKLTKITKDDAQSFIGGVIGGGFGGSFETAVEALNNKQATQILSYLPGLFKDGNIGEAEYNQAKAALERLLAQDKKLEEEIDIKSYPVDVPRMQELGYSEDDLSKLTPADVKVIDDNNVQREVFYELNQRQKEELTGEKYVAPEEPIAGEIGQTEIKVKPKVEDSPEVKSFEEFDAELDNGFSLHTRKYETGSTFEITNQSETSKGITSWGKNNPGAIYEAESFEAFEKSILHLQANDDYQILIGDNIPEEYIRKAEDKGLLKESKTKIKEVEKTAANLATNSPFTNARYWNLPKNKERKYGTSYRLPADTPPSDLPKGKTIVRLKSGEFQVFDSTTKKPVKKEKPEKRDKFAATEIGLDREKTTTAPTPKKVVIKDAIDLVNKATFGPVGERNKHDTVLNAAFKNQMKFGGEAGNFTTTENGEYRVFNFNNEYYAVPSQGFEVDRTSLKSGTVNEVFNIVGGENYKVIAPAIVEKKGSKVSVSKKGVLQVPGKFIEGYVEPEAKKEAPKKEVPKLETKEPIKPKETKKSVPSLTTKKVSTKKVGDTVKIKGPANKNKVFTVDRVLGKGEDAKYRLKDESGKSVSKTFTSKDFRDEAATVKPSDESLPETKTQRNKLSEYLDTIPENARGRKQVAASIERLGKLSDPLDRISELVALQRRIGLMTDAGTPSPKLADAVTRELSQYEAEGYFVAPLLGKPYDEGMKVIANFKPDDDAPPGSRIITRILKPQINKDGKMIQAAEIEVTQGPPVGDELDAVLAETETVAPLAAPETALAPTPEAVPVEETPVEAPVAELSPVPTVETAPEVSPEASPEVRHSVADIAKLEVPEAQNFANIFQRHIKAKDRNYEDLRRIGNELLDSAIRNPEKWVPSASDIKIEDLLRMPDGTQFDPDNFEHHLNAPDQVIQLYNLTQTNPEAARRALEDEKHAITKSRLEDIANLAGYLKDNDLYAPETSALIVYGASKWGFQILGDGKVSLVNISKNNRTMVAVVDAKMAPSIAQELQKGLPLKTAFLNGIEKGVEQAKKSNSKNRGSEWVKFTQSNKESDAARLNEACAGSSWCTFFGGVETARTQLSGGDFYVYYENGKPEIAIRMRGKEIAEVRGNTSRQTLDSKHLPILEEKFKDPELKSGADKLKKNRHRIEVVKRLATEADPDIIFNEIIADEENDNVPVFDSDHLINDYLRSDHGMNLSISKVVVKRAQDNVNKLLKNKKLLIEKGFLLNDDYDFSGYTDEELDRIKYIANATISNLNGSLNNVKKILGTNKFVDSVVRMPVLSHINDLEVVRSTIETESLKKVNSLKFGEYSSITYNRGFKVDAIIFTGHKYASPILNGPHLSVDMGLVGPRFDLADPTFLQASFNKLQISTDSNLVNLSEVTTRILAITHRSHSTESGVQVVKINRTATEPLKELQLVSQNREIVFEGPSGIDGLYGYNSQYYPASIIEKYKFKKIDYTGSLSEDRDMKITMHPESESLFIQEWAPEADEYDNRPALTIKGAEKLKYADVSLYAPVVFQDLKEVDESLKISTPHSIKLDKLKIADSLDLYTNTSVELPSFTTAGTDIRKEGVLDPYLESGQGDLHFASYGDRAVTVSLPKLEKAYSINIEHLNLELANEDLKIDGLYADGSMTADVTATIHTKHSFKLWNSTNFHLIAPNITNIRLMKSYGGTIIEAPNLLTLDNVDNSIVTVLSPTYPESLENEAARLLQEKSEDAKFNFIGEFGFLNAEGQEEIDAQSEVIEKLTDNGLSPFEVYAHTGWYYDVKDKKYKSYIDPRQAQMTAKLIDYLEGKLDVGDNAKAAKALEDHGIPLGSALDYPELYKYYPHFEAMRLIHKPSISSKAYMKLGGRVYDSDNNFLGYAPSEIVIGEFDNLADAMSSIIHEIQHAIQFYEGFAQGANHQEMVNILRFYQKQTVSRNMTESETLRIAEDVVARLKTHPPGIIENVFNQESLFSTYLARRPGYAAVTSDFQDAIYGLIKRALLRTGKPDTDSLINDYKSLSNSSKRELNGELIKAAESFTQSVRVRVEMARKNNNEGFENELKKIGLSMKDLSEEPNLNKLAMLAYKRSYGEIESRMSERNLASKSDRIVFPAHNKDYYNHAWVEQSDAKLSEFEKVVDLRDITDNPYIEISGKELRTKSLFSASPADIRLNKLSTLEELDVKYVLGINSRELGGNLYVSPEGMDYLRRLIASVKNQTPKVVNGVAVNESLKASLLKAIKDGKKEFKAAGYTEKDLQGITKIAKFLSTHPESLSLIYTNGAIIPHEMAHIARAEKSRIKEFGDYYEDFAKTFGKTEKLAEKSYEHFYKSAYFSNKDFGKLTKKEKLELQEEMVASIIQGDFERIGLTDNEAAKFLYNDLKDYVDNNGGEILTALEEWQHERIRNYGILEAIRENRPIVSKRKPAGRGSEPSPNVEVSNKTEQQSENKTETKGLLKTLESQGVVNLEDYTDESKSYVPKTLGSEAAAAQKWLNELGISRAYQEALGLKTPSALNTAKRMIVIEYLDDRIEFYTLSGNEGRARAWYDKLVMFTSSISSDFTEYGQAIAQLARWSKKSPDQLIATVNASLSNKKTPSKLTTEEENEIRRSAEEIANLDFEIRYIERLLERDDAVIIDELRQMFEDKYNGIVTMLKMILPSNQQEVEVMFDDKTEVLSSAVDKVESDIHLLEAPVRDALINLGLLVHLRGAHPYKYQDWQSAFKQEVANMGLSIDPVESYLRSTYRTVLSKENEMKRRLQIERIMEKYEFTEEGQAYEKLAELRAQRIEANKILSANKKYAKGDLDQRTPLEISIDNNLGLSYLSREDILLSMNRNEFFSTYAKKGLSFKQIMNFYLDALEVIDAAQKDLKAEKRLIRAQKHLGALNIFGGFSEEDIQKLEADLIEKRKAKSTITHELNRYIAERNKSPESRRERVLDWYKRLNRSGEAILTATIKTAMHNIIAQRGTKAFNAIEMSIATLYNKLPFWSEDPNAYDDDVEFWRPLEEEIKSSTFPQLRATVREALEGDIEIMSLARTFLFYKEMVAQGYLSHNPDLYDKMIGQFTYGDVKEKVNTIKDEWSTSTKLMEKSVRAVEHYVNMATAVNRLQEKHFRFATFIANVNLQLKAKGIDPFNVNSEDIPRDILERSVKRALEDTFGEDYNLDNVVGRLLEASNDVLSWVPFFVNPLLFRRFFFNSLKFVYDHSAMLAVKTITRDKITARDMAKFTTGITMFLMALQILRQFGTDDDDPTILKYGDYYVRVSAYNPLSNFLVLANAYNRYSKGKSVLKDKKNLLDLIGIDSRYPNVGLEFLGDLVEIFGTSPTKWVAFENTLKVTAGKGLSAFARPLSSLKDIVTLFDADQGLIRDYSEVPFYGELMKNVPYSDTFGESMGLNVPVRQNVISGEDVRKESPIMDQLGITFVSASQVGAKMTPAEEYLDTEIKGNRFILSYKTPEEKRRSGVVAQFYQALDKGIDIKAQLLREMKNRTITEDQFKDLRAAMQSKSILERKAKNASILQAVGAMDFASIEEKEVLKKILRQKIARQRKDLNSFEIERIKTVLPDFK